jgi:type I site-specific restriction-modification system R (restriction) subunit
VQEPDELRADRERHRPAPPLPQRPQKAAGEVEDNEGAERLFYTNQFLVATSYDEARVGTIGAEAAALPGVEGHRARPLADVQAELDKPTLSSQNKLIAGMLRPAHLLDIIRHFTIYQEVNGRTVKVVCRYQQFRAVQAAIDAPAPPARPGNRTASTTGAAGSSGTPRARARA